MTTDPKKRPTADPIDAERAPSQPAQPGATDGDRGSDAILSDEVHPDEEGPHTDQMTGGMAPHPPKRGVPEP